MPDEKQNENKLGSVVKQDLPKNSSSKIAWFIFLPAVVLFILLVTNAYWIRLYSKFMVNVIYHRYDWLNSIFNYFSGQGTEGGFIFFVFFLIISVIIFKVLKSVFQQQQSTIGFILIVSVVVFFILLFLVIIYYGIDTLISVPAVVAI